MKTFVIALGGNALIKPGQKGTFEEQIENIDKAVESVIGLVKRDYRLVITHGNGPQVGNMLIQQENSRDSVAPMPLFVCVAETQAQIGYMIQQALHKKLRKHKINTPVSVLMTHIVVDKNDPEFKKPIKAIGPSYSDTKGLPSQWHIKKTFRGYRRVVASPDPKEIIEVETIGGLLDKSVVIACGGGGIPVIKKGRGYEGVDAVIDKDLASARLASDIKADCLVMLTDIENLFLNWRKEGEVKLSKLTLEEIKKYYKEGHFLEGSMGPKVKAVIRFLESGGKQALIAHLDEFEKALAGKAGTIIR